MSQAVDVVGAVIVRDGLVLCAQRGPNRALAGLWEFPGGKVEHGEAPEVALAREILEELDCIIEVGDRVATTSHAYEFGTVSLTTYWAEITDGAPVASEHAGLRWIPAADIGILDWAPADVPAVDVVRETIGATAR